MIDPSIGYALIAACFGGAYIFSVKRFLSGIAPAGIAVVSSLIAAVVYVPYVVWSPANVHETVESGLSTGKMLFVALAIGTSALGFLLFLTALNHGDVSYVAPLSKVNPAFVLPIEIIAFREWLTPVQTLGVLFVTCGIYFANYQQGRIFDPFIRLVSHRPAQLALGSASVYATFDVMQRFVLQEFGIAPPLWVLMIRFGGALLLVPFAVRTAAPGAVRSRWQGFVIVGLLSVGLSHFATIAFSQLSASLASPLVNAQSIVAVALGGFLLREDAVRYRAIGAVLAVTGIALIAGI